MLVIIVLGTLILILGLRLVLQSSNAGAQSPSVNIEELQNGREALTQSSSRQPHREDFFRRGHGVPSPMQVLPRLQRPRFMKEVRPLLSQWLRKMQKQVAELMDLHLRLAGYTHEPIQD